MAKPSRISALPMLRYFRGRGVLAQAAVLLGLLFQTFVPVLAAQAQDSGLPRELAQALATICAIDGERKGGEPGHAQNHDQCCVIGCAMQLAAPAPAYDPAAAVAAPFVPPAPHYFSPLRPAAILALALDPGRPPHAPPAA